MYTDSVPRSAGVSRRRRGLLDAVVWQADGSPGGGVGYGHAIADLLVARGLTIAVVPLTERRPARKELDAPLHIISGGDTPATSSSRWVRAARRRLADVLDRAARGDCAVTGICLGAQLIAATTAGPDAVGPNPRGMEAGLTVVYEPGGLGTWNTVSTFHHHHVEPDALRAMGARLRLTNDHTVVQAFSMGPTITGLQFHPELDPTSIAATVHAHRLRMRSLGSSPAVAFESIRRRRRSWSEAGFDRFVLDPARRAGLIEQAPPEPARSMERPERLGDHEAIDVADGPTHWG